MLVKHLDCAQHISIQQILAVIFLWVQLSTYLGLQFGL